MAGTGGGGAELVEAARKGGIVAVAGASSISGAVRRYLDVRDEALSSEVIAP